MLKTDCTGYVQICVVIPTENARVECGVISYTRHWESVSTNILQLVRSVQHARHIYDRIFKQ